MLIAILFLVHSDWDSFAEDPTPAPTPAPPTMPPTKNHVFVLQKSEAEMLQAERTKTVHPKFHHLSASTKETCNKIAGKVTWYCCYMLLVAKCVHTQFQDVCGDLHGQAIECTDQCPPKMRYEDAKSGDNFIQRCPFHWESAMRNDFCWPKDCKPVSGSMFRLVLMVGHA